MESSGKARRAASEDRPSFDDGPGEGRALKPHGTARSTAVHRTGLGSRRTERAPLSTTVRATG